MVQYQINVAEKLREKGYTSYSLLKSGLIPQGTLTKLNHKPEDISLNISVKTLDTICQLLECNIEDVVRIIPDEDFAERGKRSNKTN